MIKEAIRQNNSLNIFIINKDIQYEENDSRESEWSFYRQLAELSQHITIVSETFSDFVKNIPYDTSKKPEEIFLEKLENIMSAPND
jgi:predicted patatin/cPLA2 family phospholipase